MKILVLNHAPFQSPDAKFYTIQIHSVHGEPNGSLVQNIVFGFFLMFLAFSRTTLPPTLVQDQRSILLRQTAPYNRQYTAWFAALLLAY